MNLTELFNDKSLKPKEKTEMLCGWLMDKKLNCADLIAFAENAKDPVKATCIEAMEYVSKQNPQFVDEKAFLFACRNLSGKAPRVKWESARVIGNTAHLFPKKLNEAIPELLTNSEHEGTVVRWSAAYALGEIFKLKSKFNSDLLPAFEAICKREEKNSIRKIYLDAIKKASK